MGLLTIDSVETLDYQQSKPHQKKLKKAGMTQLLILFKKYKHEKKDFKRYPKYGYEIEGHLLQKIKDIQGTNYQLQIDTIYLKENLTKTFKIVDEYGRWMVELIPRAPMEDFLYSGVLQTSIQNIFKQIKSMVKENDVYLSYPLPPKFGTLSYPNFYCPGLTHEELEKRNEKSKSEYMADEMINTHPRFPTFTQNVRQRRHEKPQIIAEIYKDKNTDMENILPGEKEPGKIQLDAFTFGMGMCSLQVTFGVSNLAQARWLYDQYHVFTPLWVNLFNIACSFGLYPIP
jgi:glutamate--cysteine ligase catalytic subunit